MCPSVLKVLSSFENLEICEIEPTEDLLNFVSVKTEG